MVLRGEFTAFNIFIRKEESRINDLGFCLKKITGKMSQLSPRAAEEKKSLRLEQKSMEFIFHVTKDWGQKSV